MKQEIEAAARWFVNLLKSKDLEFDQLAKFETTLVQLLTAKYTNHWYTNTPWRGQGYRSIIIDEYSIDKLLKKAARAADIDDVHKRMPTDSFVMWVDPGEVEVKYLKTSRTEVVFSSSHTMAPSNDVHRLAEASSSLRILQRSPPLTLGEEDKLSANERPTIFRENGTGVGLIGRPRSVGTDRSDRSLYNSHGHLSSDGVPVRFVKDVNNNAAKMMLNNNSRSIWDNSVGGSFSPARHRVATPSKLNLHARPFIASRTNEWANVVKTVKK